MFLINLIDQIENDELTFDDTLDDGTPVEVFLAEELAFITTHPGSTNDWHTTGEAATKLGIRELAFRNLLHKMDAALQNGKEIDNLILEWKDPTDEQCRTFRLLTNIQLIEL